MKDKCNMNLMLTQLDWEALASKQAKPAACKVMGAMQ